MKYFEGMFKAESHDRNFEFLSDLSGRVTAEMNEMLTRPFTEDEVTATLQHMNPTKAHVPDGVAHVFYQKYWNTVGKSHQSNPESLKY